MINIDIYTYTLFNTFNIILCMLKNGIFKNFIVLFNKSLLSVIQVCPCPD